MEMADSHDHGPCKRPCCNIDYVKTKQNPFFGILCSYPGKRDTLLVQKSTYVWPKMKVLNFLEISLPELLREFLP